MTNPDTQASALADKLDGLLKSATPGPWKVYHALLRKQFPGNRIIEIQDANGDAVVMWSGFDNSDRLKKTHLANARLIAALCSNPYLIVSALRRTRAEGVGELILHDQGADAVSDRYSVQTPEGGILFLFNPVDITAREVFARFTSTPKDSDR